MASAKPRRPTKKPGKRVTSAPETRRALTRALGGIPLRRKTVWAVDMESAEFKSARRRDRAAVRAPGADQDGLAFVEAALADPAVAKWWK